MLVDLGAQKLNGRVLLFAQVLDGSVLQKIIAGMHKNDPLFEAIEQRRRILPGQNRVGGIIVNAEPDRRTLVR
jgi:hypothetical protein